MTIPSQWMASLAFALALSGAAFADPGADEAALRRLNDDYARAFVASDASRFRDLLSDDFQAVLADGRRIDRAEFLRQAGRPAGAIDFRVRDVEVRLFGDTALVGALAAYRRADGAVVRTRYLGVWVRGGARWRIVSIQFTRIAAPP
jgi:ketosteroid isomerase-like protein